MAKYSKKAQDKIGDVMHEYKHGELKSGAGGKGGKVRSREQAVAIALSEARAAGAKVPKNPKKKEGSSKMTAKKSKASSKSASSKSGTKRKSSSRKSTTAARKSRPSVRGSKSSPGSKSASSRSKRPRVSGKSAT